jgi:3-oxoacyl-[acyl-carrier-protein] synthase-3
MADVYIDHLSFALGDTARSVDQAVAEKVTLSSAEVLREAGFLKHHVCRPGTTAYDLAKRAVEPIPGRHRRDRLRHLRAGQRQRRQ